MHRIQDIFKKSWQLLTKSLLLRLTNESKHPEGVWWWSLKNLNTRDKNFQKFKKFRLHIDKELFKKAKYEALKLVATKKQAVFKEKISESISKPKELWKSLKCLGIPNKTPISNFNAMEYNETLTYATRSISTVFKNVFSDLAGSGQV